MKIFYTLLPLMERDPMSKYVNELGQEFPKCTEKVYFPITAYISSVIEEEEHFIVYCLDSKQNDLSLHKATLLKNELDSKYPNQCTLHYLKADLRSDAQGQVQTFKQIYETFVVDEKETHEVYFDFTFGFRPTPMTVFVACNYAEKFLKNVKIKSLFYSQYNHTKPSEPQLIIDITSLFLLDGLITTLSSINSKDPMKFIDKVFKLD